MFEQNYKKKCGPDVKAYNKLGKFQTSQIATDTFM